jgi:hypothetical protein
MKVRKKTSKLARKSKALSTKGNSLSAQPSASLLRDLRALITQTRELTARQVNEQLVSLSTGPLDSAFPRTSLIKSEEITGNTLSTH